MFKIQIDDQKKWEQQCEKEKRCGFEESPSSTNHKNQVQKLD